MKNLRTATSRLALLAAFALSSGACAATAQQAKPAKVAPAPSLMLAPLAGQAIPVLPITFLLSDSATPPGLPAGNAARLAWADSIVASTLQMRGPEVSWVLPAELRKVAKRAPGLVTDPDRMGQAMLRNDGFTKTPDPLRSYLRALSAMTDARDVLVPAAVRFVPAATGAKVEVTLVLVDSRNGQVLFRSHPVGSGATAADALTAAIAHILPDNH
ncbi:MAG: hypothetical protein ABIZ70_06205 [Gemmatimonadales bacterium]